MKRKTYVGGISLLCLLFMSFMGIFYSYGGDWGKSFIIFLIVAFLTIGLLYLAVTGRETHEQYNTLWTIAGWIAFGCLLCSMTFHLYEASHFMQVRHNTIKISDVAHDNIDAITVLFEDYERMTQDIESKLEGELLKWINHGDKTALNNYSGLPNSIDYYNSEWVKQQKETICQMLKEGRGFCYNDHKTNWNDTIQLQLQSLYNGDADLFSIAPNAVLIDTYYKGLFNGMEDKLKEVVGKLQQKGIDAEANLSPSKPIKSCVTDMVTKGDRLEGSPISLLAYFLAILSLCPFIFVRRNRVKTDNKRFANIFQEGYPLK